MALADGAHGHLRMLADCRDGFYILAIGFADHFWLNGASQELDALNCPHR